MIGVEKWHGAGNEFLIVDAAESTVADRRAFAVRECDPERGTGADGVLFLTLAAEATPVRVTMRLYQPDGSTAAMCGNGARCAAAWAARRSGADVVIVDTPAGERRAEVGDGVVSIEMGSYSFAPEDVPLARDRPLVEEQVGDLVVTAVTTGVPHAVSFVDDVDDVALETVAPAVRHAEVFPDGANVTIADGDGRGFRQRTYERGVEGETVACGTGAVAIVAVARRRGEVDVGEPISVSPPGGDLEVTLHGDGTATLTGPVAHTLAREVEPA